MNKSLPPLLFLVYLLFTQHAAADAPLTDFWHEAPRIFGVASGSQTVDTDLEKRLRGQFADGLTLDHADHRVGDFSLAYKTAEGSSPERFGFVAGLFGETWELSKQHELKVWLKFFESSASDNWTIRLVDVDGRKASAQLENIRADWKEYVLPLRSFSADRGFDWNTVRTCDFAGDFGDNAVIKIDGLRFEKYGTVTGVTDKPISQRMAEAEANLEQRLEHGLRAATKKKEGAQGLTTAFNKMMLNEDLEWANEMLREQLLETGESQTWSLFLTPAYCRFYYWFSNANGKYPGRLTADNKKLLLETLWSRTLKKNDIHWARQSTWYLDGSENHDLNSKAANLVVSRIFMNEPAYKDRILPNYGFGGAYGYGRSGYYGPGIDPDSRHGGGRANLSDGGQYTAKDHYEAWLAYMKEYFRTRAERGFFLEYGSNTYTKHTLNFVDLAYQYSGDDELKSLIDDFLTLFWAEWAQVAISGDRGGPKTRHHKGVAGGGASGLVGFKLGGTTSAGIWSYWNLINDYRLPPVVWHMILNRQGMGSYTYRARGIGEEENVFPRPLGTERSLVVDTDARFLKSTFVTPDYTLGTQMDHLSAVHSHLSIGGRWHGMTFAQNINCRIVPVALSYPGNPKNKEIYNMEGVWQTAHHKQTLIVQQARRWYAVHPDWFPANIRSDLKVGIWLGDDWERKVERDGWIFVQSGQAYAAVRPVLWDAEFEAEKWKQSSAARGVQKNFNSAEDDAIVRLRTDSYSWHESGKIIELKEKHMPVIIEAGHQNDYPSLEAFIDDILNNPLALHKTVVPGDFILVYTGNDGSEMTFGCAAPQLPTVNGVPVNYSHPMTFDSPSMQSHYKSGIIDLDFGGEGMRLDFTRVPYRNKP